MIHASDFARLGGALALAGVMLTGVGAATAAELTLDVSDYSYEETENDSFKMADDSDPPFVALGIRDWDRPKENGKFGLMYTGEGTVGRVAYDSANSGTLKKRYYRARMEGYLGYRLNDYATPYVGIGYQFLHDDSGGKIGDNNGIFYDRQNHLLYMPFGVRVDPMDKLSLKLQANLLIKGMQIS